MIYFYLSTAFFIGGLFAIYWIHNQYHLDIVVDPAPFLGLRDRSALLLLGAFGAVVELIAALFLPVWPVLGVLWHLHGGGWLAATVVAKSLILWAFLIYVRACSSKAMDISPWYAFTTPFGAAIFTAMMLTSAGNIPIAIRASSKTKTIVQTNCIHCHEAATEEIVTGAQPFDRYCWDCHRTVAHGSRGISIVPYPDSISYLAE